MSRNANLGFSIKQANLNLATLNSQIADQSNRMKHLNDEISRFKILSEEIQKMKAEEKIALSQIQQELEQRDKLTNSALSDLSEKLSTKAEATDATAKELQSLLTNITDIVSSIDTHQVGDNGDNGESNPTLQSRSVVIDTPIPEPEFKPSEVDNDTIARDICLIQMGDGSNDVKLSKNTNGEELFTLSNDLGGIMLNKIDSEDGWIIESSIDNELNFHYNSLSNQPLTVTPSGLKVPRIDVGGHTITNISGVINDETVNNKTIPTTAAVVKYMNSNLKKIGIMKCVQQGISGSSSLVMDESIISQQPSITSSSEDITLKSGGGIGAEPSVVAEPEAITMKDCNIGVIDVGHGKTLLIENETNSISFRDGNKIISPIFSHENGVEINNKFSLKNDVGTLCIYQGSETDLVGRFVKITKRIHQIDDLFVPEVRLPSEQSSDIFGVIKSKIENRYVTNNIIYKLNPSFTYVLVASSGIIRIPKIKETFETGAILLPDKVGMPTNNYGTPGQALAKTKLKEIDACVSKCIPMIKVLSFEGNDMIVQIING
jgi:hypothetical protein